MLGIIWRDTEEYMFQFKIVAGRVLVRCTLGSFVNIRLCCGLNAMAYLG